MTATFTCASAFRSYRGTLGNVNSERAILFQMMYQDHQVSWQVLEGPGVNFDPGAAISDGVFVTLSLQSTRRLLEQ